jgi:hypothetical protein
MKTFAVGRIQNYSCVEEHVAPVMHDRKQSAERNSETKRFRFIGFVIVLKILVLFDTVDVFSAVACESLDITMHWFFC